MRVLIVSQYFWPENFRVNDLVSELVYRGHNVTVLTGYPNYPEGLVFKEFCDEPLKFSNYEGAEIVRVPIFPRGKGGWRLIINYLSFILSASVIGLWKLRHRKYDAVFTYQPSPITVGLPAALIAKIKRAPMVLWVLDLWPDTLEAVGMIKSKSILRVVGKVVSFVYNCSDLILAQSKSFIPHIQKYTAPDKRVLYFPSWAETTFDTQHSVVATEVPLGENFFSIMFAGNIGDAQDFPAILSAAEILKTNTRIRWLIVGEGRMLSWVKSEVKRRRLETCFLLLGRYPLEKMPSFFKAADVLLVSLKDEPIFSMTIPGKLQSYLASGIPIVAMLNGEGSDIIRSYASGLTCAAGDHVGLADAVTKLSLMSTTELINLGENAARASESEFSRSSLITRLENLLEELRNTNNTASINHLGRHD